MLDECQQFKAAFLLRCSEQGLSDDETLELIKVGCAHLSGQEKSALSLADFIPTVGGTLKTTLGIPAAIAIGGGAMLGAGAAHLPSFSDTDPKELTTQEKIEAYRRVTARVEMQQKLRNLQRSTAPSYQRF